MKMACSGKHSLESTSKSLLKTSWKMLWYECNTPWKMPLLRVSIVAIASVIVMVASKINQNQNQKIVDLPI